MSDEERARRREADRQRSIEAVRALQTSEGWQNWLSSRRYFRKYSLANQLVIARSCPHATYVAGFRAWLKLGYCVRRGERAIRIWVPMAPSKAQLDAWRQAGSLPEDKPRTWFKLGPVFDHSQVEELPPPAEPVSLDCPIGEIEGDELEWCTERLIAFAGSIGSAVRFEAMPAECGGYYDTDSRAIAINDTGSVNAQVKTLLHEVAHALMRAEPREDGPDLAYAEEELVVESIAYTVCGSVGLDVSSYAIPYLASWSEAAPLETVQACAGIIDRYARRLEEVLEREQAEVAA